MRRIAVILIALAMAGMPVIVEAHHKEKHDGGTAKVYHCHATGATAENGGARYNLLHLPLAAASKNNVHGAVEIRIGTDGSLLCPDDDGYDDSTTVLHQELAH